MGQVILYGAICGLALVLGAFFALVFKLNKKTIAGIMAFGSGALICALTFGLMESAFGHGGFDAIIIGFVLGGLAFIAGDYLIHLLGGRKHKAHQHTSSKYDTSGEAITLGAILDGLPESIALGISIFASQGLGLLMVVAISLSNFPEGVSSVPGLTKEGFSRQKIIITWLVVALVSVAAAIISYAFLAQIDPNILGIIEAFAAGAILAMLADTMMPEAFDKGGFGIGILTVLGFLTTFVVSKF